MGQGDVAALGADGVGLPVELLDEEVQLPAHGPALAEHLLQLGEMAAQADGLLIYGDLVGKDGRLREDAALVQLLALQDFLHPGGELLAILRHGLWGTGLHLLHQLGDPLRLAAKISAEFLPLPLPHGIEPLQGLGQDSTDILGDKLRVRLLLLHQQHVGETGEQGDGQIVPQAVNLPQLLQGRVVAVGHRPVQLDVHLIGGGAVDAHKDIHLPPAHALLDLGLDPLLGKDIEPGDLDGAV